MKEQEQPAIVVGVVEEHHHVLQYYAREVAKNTLPVDSKATILHLDSHADMGVPRAYLKADEHMERFSAINDFYDHGGVDWRRRAPGLCGAAVEQPI